jgi:alkylhydroperoxidase family enzyme
MKMRSIFGAAYTAIAIAVATPVAAHGIGETVTPHFQQAITNLPGKSPIAVFEERELVDLTIAISLMNVYNRMAISFRNTPQAAIEMAA